MADQVVNHLQELSGQIRIVIKIFESRLPTHPVKFRYSSARWE